MSSPVDEPEQVAKAPMQPNNQWARGPPVIAPAPAKTTAAPNAAASANVAPIAADKPAAPRVGRVHHHLSPDELRELAYQMGIAQQIALQGHNYGLDPMMYQAQLAMTYGLDPSTLNIPGRQPEISEPPLGQTPYGDERVYSNIELVTMYPQIAHVNQTPILDLRRGVFFLATTHERTVHESIKYSAFAIPAEGVPTMNRAFGENVGHTPIYVIVASTDVGVFSGICEVMGPPHATGAGEAHRFPVRWLLCKNIPFSYLPAISLRGQTPEAEAHRQSGGLLALPQADGIKAIQIFARVPPGCSVLMDFKHYDEAEAKGVVAESGHASIRKLGGQPRQDRRPYQPRVPTFFGPRGQLAAAAAASGAGAASTSSAPLSGAGPSGGARPSSYRQPRQVVRRVEASDGERVALQDKFELQPVQKVRQGKAKKKAAEPEPARAEEEPGAAAGGGGGHEAAEEQGDGKEQ